MPKKKNVQRLQAEAALNVGHVMMAEIGWMGPLPVV